MTLLVWRLGPSDPLRCIPSPLLRGPKMATVFSSVVGFRPEWEATKIWLLKMEELANWCRAELEWMARAARWSESALGRCSNRTTFFMLGFARMACSAMFTMLRDDCSAQPWCLVVFVVSGGVWRMSGHIWCMSDGVWWRRMVSGACLVVSDTSLVVLGYNW